MSNTNEPRTWTSLGRGLAVVLSVPLALSSLPVASSATTSDPTAAADANRATVTVRLREGIRNLPVAAETRAGYEREKFRHWVDADGDCRDTRDEVLAEESLVAVHGCDVQSGKWRSYYDGVVTRDSTSFDIDHVVSVATTGIGA